MCPGVVAATAAPAVFPTPCKVCARRRYSYSGGNDRVAPPPDDPAPAPQEELMPRAGLARAVGLIALAVLVLAVPLALCHPCLQGPAPAAGPPSRADLAERLGALGYRTATLE